jgi:glycosyltransferase involved in cell wall biosynthesis
MKVLIALTYYRPHTSGLTIYAERLARALAERGHRVTVLTSQYDKSLPRTEYLHGVDVVRVPVAFRISKGVIMPTFGVVAWQMVRPRCAQPAFAAVRRERPGGARPLAEKARGPDVSLRSAAAAGVV